MVEETKALVNEPVTVFEKHVEKGADNLQKHLRII
jgi:hypothetical protein